ncbi:MAG TPA: hypothetical protein VFK32_07900 [Tepidiformaceae bacterium]|nr:hypothetical protein [Tepidiformaceae bacterium]
MVGCNFIGVEMPDVVLARAVSDAIDEFEKEPIGQEGVVDGEVTSAAPSAVRR